MDEKNTINHFELLTVDGFIRAFEKNLSSYPTKQMAFDAVNNEHLKHFKKTKYSNYDSFRQIRNRKLKK